MTMPPPIPSRPDSRPAATPTSARRRVHACRSPSSSSATRRSCGVVTLKFSGVDSTTRTVPPARSTSQASSVARGERGGVDVERPLERLAAERLRRLDRPQARAVVRGDHAAVGARLLDRVGHDRGGDRGVGVGQRGERGGEVLGRHERPRGVVDDDLRRRAAPPPARGAPTPSASPRRSPRRSRPAPPHPAAARPRCPRSPPPAGRRGSTPASGDRRERRTPWADRAPRRSPLPAATSRATATFQVLRGARRPPASPRRSAGGARRGAPRPAPHPSRARTSARTRGSSSRG